MAPPTTATSDPGSGDVTLTTPPHVLIFPYPAQGHMLPLLDLTHQLAIRNVTLTVLVTPKNLPLLSPLLSQHPSIATLVFPFPANPEIPAGVENCQDLPAGGFREMIPTLGGLRDPIIDWFRDHPSPPTAIISDTFLGFTRGLAEEIGVRRYTFSPSGAMAMSVIFKLWREMPRRGNPDDQGEVIGFPGVPGLPEYPWWQLSPIYRTFKEGDSKSEFIRGSYLGSMESYGLLFNTFGALEGVYLEHLKKYLGNERIWAVGPLLPPDNHRPGGDPAERNGSSDILSWLDSLEDNSVVYVCFGTQAVLSNQQMEALALGLEKSGVHFLWSAKKRTKGHVDECYGTVPPGFQERVGKRGLVVQDWVPQVLILRHRAIAAFLTHCGWNSTLEGIVASVPLITWPMGADQYANADLLVKEYKIAIRACEGNETIPDSEKLAHLLAKVVKERAADARDRSLQLKHAALDAIKEGGDSFINLDTLVKHLCEEASKIIKM